MQRTIGTTGLAFALAISALGQAPPAPPAPPAQGGPPPARGNRSFATAPRAAREGGPGGPRRALQPDEAALLEITGLAGGPGGPRRALQPGPGGRWWNDPEMVQKLSLNSDQQKKMDDIFQQNRLKLIDLNATLEKDEITLEPLVSADAPEEAKILAQIDRVAQARAELEKANARFLLGIRRVLTQDQWKKLQAERPGPGGPARGMGGPGGPGGPGGGPGGPGRPGGPPPRPAGRE